MSSQVNIQGITTLDQGFVSNEIEDVYASHLNLNQFCTVDNELQGVPGDRRKINVYGAAGNAEKVTEGNGNSGSISTSLVEKEYVIECAQNWLKYSDEALMRDPVSVQTGLSRLGASLFDQVNDDIYAEFQKAVLYVTSSTPDFDAFVDAVSKIDFVDGNESAIEYEGRTIPTVWAICNAKTLAAARKAMKAQIVYDPNLAWAQGYVGTIAGVPLYVKKNLADDVLYVGTNKAVTVFNKTGVNTEIAARGADEANKRLNNIFARKYYIAALTDASQICQIGLTGGALHTIQIETGDGLNDTFVLDETATDSPVVTVDGVAQVAGTDYTFATNTVTFTTAPANNAVIAIEYHFTA